MQSPYPIHNDSLTSLRRVALALLAFSAFFLFLTHRFLAHFWEPGGANRWLLLSSGLMLLLVWAFWRNLSRNYRTGERSLLPTLGAGNTLTFLRGLLIAATAGFLFLPPPEGWLAWAPAVFYTLASLGDFIDGYLARRQAHATRLGEILDMLVDGMGVLVAAALLVHYGKVPDWFLLVGLARYLFLAGVWFRRRRGLPVLDLPPSDARRALAAVQMVLIFILLWPLFPSPATSVVAAAFAVPFLVNFLRDWFIVSGAVDHRSGFPFRDRAQFRFWLPLFLRAAIFTLALASARDRFTDLPAFFTLLELGLALMAFSGFAGRTVSLAALVLIGLGSNFLPFTELDALRVIFYTGLFHFGTGNFSVWEPEKQLIGLRAGQVQTDAPLTTRDSHLDRHSSTSEAS